LEILITENDLNLTQFCIYCKWHGIDAGYGKNKTMRITLILTCILMTSIPSLAKNNKTKTHSSVRVLAKRMDIFYFKVDEDIIGAEIEVYNDKGEKLITAVITHRHAIVDFFNENPGHYIIKINKGDFNESFDYEKFTPSPFTPIEVSKISLVQG
jgi:hypothetical protein